MIKNYIPATYTMDFKNIDDYTDIMRFCRLQDVQIYVYCFTWKGHVLKYGIQHKFGNGGNDYGERAYTQAGHMPGWSKPNLKRAPSTKADIDDLIFKIETTFNVIFDKNDVVLTIMDYTLAPFEIDNPRAELQRIEDDLVDSHVINHGHRPMGNKIQTVAIKKTPLMRSTGLFDWP
jgi:hypothetical protein